MSAGLLSRLWELQLDEFTEQLQVFLATGQPYEVVYSTIVSIVDVMQKRSADLKDDQKELLVSAAVICCRHVQTVPAQSQTKYVDLLYYLMYATYKIDLQHALSLGQLLCAAVGDDSYSYPPQPVGAAVAKAVSNASRLLLSSGRQQLNSASGCRQLAGQLFDCGLQLLGRYAVGGCGDSHAHAKLGSTVVVLTESLLPLLVADPLILKSNGYGQMPATLAKLSAAASAMDSGRLVLAAVRLAAGLGASCGDQLLLLEMASSVSEDGRGGGAALTAVKLVECFLQAVVASSSGEEAVRARRLCDHADAVLGSMTSPQDDPGLALLTSEALYTVYTVARFTLGGDNVDRVTEYKISVSVARLVCAAATLLLSRCADQQLQLPAAPHLSPMVAGRAANMAHSICVLAVRHASASRRLLEEMSRMSQLLRQLPSQLVAAEDVRWCTSVLLMMSGNVCAFSSSSNFTDLSVSACRFYLQCADDAVARGVQVSLSSVTSRVNHLALLLRQQGVYQEALQSLAHAIWLLLGSHDNDTAAGSASNSSQLADQLMQTWAFVKRSARRRDKQDSCLTVTVKDLLERWGQVDQAVLVSLLKLEVKYCFKSGSNMAASINAATDQLGRHQLQLPTDRAWLQVARVRFNQLDSPAQALAECRHALRTIEALMKKSKTADLRMAHCIASYYSYISGKQLEMQEATRVPLSVCAGDASTTAGGRPRDPGDEVDPDASCSVSADHLQLNVAREAASLQPLYSCLRTARGLLKAGVLETVDYSSADVLAVLSGAAEVYSGLGYSVMALIAWRTLFQAASTANNANGILNAVCELSERHGWLGVFDVSFCPAIDELSGTAALDTLRRDLARAWRHYHCHEIGAVDGLLASILTDPVLTTRWLDNFAAAASAHRLAASVCACANGNKTPTALLRRTRLDLAALSCFYTRCLVVWSRDDKSLSLSQRLYYNGLAHDVTLAIGRTYARLHFVRELRSRCREHLQAAHDTATALRLASLLSLLVEADLLCEDSSGATTKLATLSRMLDGESAPAVRCSPPLPPLSDDLPVVVVQPAAPDDPHDGGASILELPRSPRHGAVALSVADNTDGATFGTPSGRDSRWSQQLHRCASPQLVTLAACRRAPADEPLQLSSHGGGCMCAVCCEPQRLRVCLLVRGCYAARLSSLLGSEQHGPADAVHLCQTALQLQPTAEQLVCQLLSAELCVDGEVASSTRSVLLEGCVEDVCLVELETRLTLADIQVWWEQLPAAQLALDECGQQLLLPRNAQLVNHNIGLVDWQRSLSLLLRQTLSWDCDSDASALSADLAVIGIDDALLDGLEEGQTPAMAAEGRVTPVKPPVQTTTAAPPRKPRKQRHNNDKKPTEASQDSNKEQLQKTKRSTSRKQLEDVVDKEGLKKLSPNVAVIAEVKTPSTAEVVEEPASPPLVRSMRRKAAVIKSQIEKCPPRRSARSKRNV